VGGPQPEAASSATTREIVLVERTHNRCRTDHIWSKSIASSSEAVPFLADCFARLITSCPGVVRAFGPFRRGRAQEGALDVAWGPGLGVLRSRLVITVSYRRPGPTTQRAGDSSTSLPRPGESHREIRIPSHIDKPGRRTGSAGVLAARSSRESWRPQGSASWTHTPQERSARQCLLGDDHGTPHLKRLAPTTPG